MSRYTRKLNLVNPMVTGIIALLFLYPIVWILTTAYKPVRDIFSVPPSFTFTPILKNFTDLFAIFNIPGLLANSLMIGVGTTVMALLLGVPCGYALARSKTRYANAIAFSLLAIRMMPRVVTLLPFYLMMRSVDLLGTVWAVIIFDTTLSAGFVVWTMYAYFKALPVEAEQAAQLDGRSRVGAFVFVAIPLVIPGIISSALFTLILAWNDFIGPVFLTGSESKPLSVAILSSYGTKDVSWGTMGAMSHFSVLPIVLIAMLLNRYFVKGMTKGMH
ncbi:carbohydrate ABC transporter permease [Erwinia sp. JUb26]|uniref:carbohydrate ABC transporter permease n=1 Tax=Erwinia sp. JUb26 TaxID=2485126 RepID=UPI000F4AE14F|nr:carbohydrate ABC transporter permease [Erwinia sp. JUb26]ROR11427.1 multiple sugar transport system permease protein [Erwinia sp. JUb26]